MTSRRNIERFRPRVKRSEPVEDLENSPIAVGVNTAQGVPGRVWGKDATEAFLFRDDPLDLPKLLEFCCSLLQFGWNARPDDAELA
jgi:hypothetical protein